MKIFTCNGPMFEGIIRLESCEGFLFMFVLLSMTINQQRAYCNHFEKMVWFFFIYKKILLEFFTHPPPKMKNNTLEIA